PTDPIEEQDTRPYPPPPPPPEEKLDSGEANTVSLLDLMDNADDDAPTVTLSGASEDENTPTAGTQPPTTKRPAPVPLTPPELKPKERPLEQDIDATIVQPRVAIPDTRPQKPRPPADQPTRPQPRPSTPDDDFTVQGPAAAAPVRQQPPPPTATPKVAMAPAAPKTYPARKSPGRRDWGGCLWRFALAGGMFVMVFAAISLFLVVLGYRSIAGGLPDVSELEAKVSQFETAVIYDRNGNELYALADPNTGNRTRVSLAQISPTVISATIATEDARFYENPGFDPIGISRAIVQAAQEGEVVSGASTITQQLVRAVLLDEEERAQITFRRKVREIILAAEMANTYPKDQILELYLNEIYYGNLAYGIEAAAQTYFGKPAGDLTLAEASLLAGLPQAPAAWDPYTAPQLAIGRQSEVLTQMVAEGYITQAEAQAALNETNAFIYNMTPPATTLRYPHFTLTALQQAEEMLGAQNIYRGGLRIFTTIDPGAQQLAEATVANAQPNIQAAGANNAAMVVMEPSSGEILALVGSVDFDDETIDGQVNMVLAPRQTGSAIKPLVYLSAMERGWTPATLIWDVPTSFPNGTNPPYEPKNYDDRFHGPIRLRPALGNSYNIPAVKALEYVGVCNFIDNAQKLGVDLQDEGCAELGQPRSHGLSLALGGGEISPLEMAAAFGTFANQGVFNEPFTIRRIEDRNGEIIFERQPTDPAAGQVVRPEHAYLLSDILSDNNARQPAFGLNNPLVIPGHRVAAKTGTSGTDRFDVRDAWTIGFTPEVVTAVWVGNTDNQPIGEGQSGTQVAAPIWNAFMRQYLINRAPVDFIRPFGIIDVEICADSGTRSGPGCRSRLIERFAGDQPPLDSSLDFIQNVPIDVWTGLRANEFCTETVQEMGFFDILVSGNAEVLLRERTVAQQWLENTGSGQAWAASR
ncbi:MAG TPA: PBP1A family penicillin-binding protein, partial [Anaerolineae bacterium]|nr:PBP1A family penicillin-binding protein [Anaerolineae bacterium]